jgi:AraC-like DNA-binding protein
MRYEETPPPDQLRAAIASLWRFNVDRHDPPTFDHTIPPDGCVNLAVVRSAGSIERIAVVGPRLSALRVPVRRGVEYFGLRARPEAGWVVAGGPPARLRERVTPVDLLDETRAGTIRAHLAKARSADGVLDGLTKTVAGWLAEAPPLDSLVGRMIERLVSAHGQMAVGRLAEGFGVGYRQGLRRFNNAVGLSPKEFARLARLRHACLVALDQGETTWATVSADAGFSDQAHMNREFSDVFGWPPGLVREYLRRIEHVGVAS